MKFRKVILLYLFFLFIPSFVYADSDIQSNCKCVMDNGNIFLMGKYLELGISPRGSFGALTSAPSTFYTLGNNTTIGISFNNLGFNNSKKSSTGDYIIPKNEEMYMIGYVIGDKDGEVNEIKIAEKNGIREFPNPIKDLKTETTCDYSTGLLKATTTGISKDNLKITITQEFYNSNKYFKTTVELENLSDEVMAYLRYLRSMNPNQDYYLYNTYKTLNKVISNPRPPYKGNMYSMVVAKGKLSNESIFYISYDKRARSSIKKTISSIYNESLWIESNTSIPTNPTREVNVSDYIYDDSSITLTFNLGDLSPKEKVNFEYLTVFSSTITEGLDSLPVLEEQIKEINIKNYPKSSNKKDYLEISKLNIGDKIDLYSDSSMNNKLLTITVNKNNSKNNKLTYKVDKNILDDDGGIIYLKITSSYEDIPLIRYSYPNTNYTTISLMGKRLIYTLIIVVSLSLIYYLFQNKKKRVVTL